jgi:hypothetical protein
MTALIAPDPALGLSLPKETTQDTYLRSEDTTGGGVGADSERRLQRSREVSTV